jgi:transcriptional regulator with PAS, ATPase and Fis domain
MSGTCRRAGRPTRPIRLTPIQTAEAEAIAKALRTHGHNKVAAAAEFGISRSSLYRKMQAYRLR